MPRKIHYRKVLYGDTNEISTINIFSLGHGTKNLYMNKYNKSGSVGLISLLSENKKIAIS